MYKQRIKSDFGFESIKANLVNCDKSQNQSYNIENFKFNCKSLKNALTHRNSVSYFTDANHVKPIAHDYPSVDSNRINNPKFPSTQNLHNAQKVNDASLKYSTSKKYVFARPQQRLPQCSSKERNINFSTNYPNYPQTHGHKEKENHVQGESRVATKRSTESILTSMGHHLESSGVFDIISSVEIIPDKSVFRGWKVLSLLGSGTFASVYKLQNLRTGEIVAAKLLEPQKFNMSTQCRVVEMFSKEVKYFAECQCPGVVKLKKLVRGVEGWMMYQELIEGGTLWDDFDTENELESFKLFLQLLQSLMYIQSQFVVHRDLKPTNILRSKDKKRLYITDFGWSETYADLNSHTHELPGTIEINPPEVLGHTKFQSEKIDNYALAMNMMLLLSKHFVCREKSLSTSEAAKKVLDKICVIRSNNPLKGFHKDAWEVFLGLSNFDPKNRLSLAEVIQTRWFLTMLAKLMSNMTEQEYKSLLKNQLYNSAYETSFIWHGPIRQLTVQMLRSRIIPLRRASRIQLKLPEEPTNQCNTNILIGSNSTISSALQSSNLLSSNVNNGEQLVDREKSKIYLRSDDYHKNNYAADRTVADNKFYEKEKNDIQQLTKLRYLDQSISPITRHVNTDNIKQKKTELNYFQNTAQESSQIKKTTTNTTTVSTTGSLDSLLCSSKKEPICTTVSTSFNDTTTSESTSFPHRQSIRNVNQVHESLNQKETNCTKQSNSFASKPSETSMLERWYTCVFNKKYSLDNLEQTMKNKLNDNCTSKCQQKSQDRYFQIPALNVKKLIRENNEELNNCVTPLSGHHYESLKSYTISPPKPNVNLQLYPSGRHLFTSRHSKNYAMPHPKLINEKNKQIYDALRSKSISLEKGDKSFYQRHFPAAAYHTSIAAPVNYLQQ